MLSETQLTEIRNYLLSKKLPIDILIEVNDHFVSQISDLQREENLCFEEAFEKTKENWKEEFKTTVPFYVVANKDKRATTNFEKKIRKIENYNVLKISLVISFFHLSLFFILSNFYDVKNLRTYFFIFIIFPVLTIVYNYIFNSFAYKEKFKEIRFSVYHWRIFLIFSLGYFGLQYIKPFDEVISNLYQNKLDIETIIKLIVFIILVIGFNYTGVAQFKFAKTMKKVKPFLKYL